MSDGASLGISGNDIIVDDPVPIEDPSAPTLPDSDETADPSGSGEVDINSL